MPLHDFPIERVRDSILRVVRGKIFVANGIETVISSEESCASDTTNHQRARAVCTHYAPHEFMQCPHAAEAIRRVTRVFNPARRSITIAL